MTDIVGRLRRMVADTGTAFWTDGTDLQNILDSHRLDFWQTPLEVEKQQIAAGTVQYKTYRLPHTFLEGTASGTALVRIYDSQGTVVSGYALDQITGIVTFTADQEGSARYMDGRAYNMHAAAAEAWEERMADVSDDYSFSADGARFDRSDWFDHCTRMVEFHKSKAWVTQPDVIRGDMNA